MRKPFRQKLLLLAGSLLASVLVAELVLRTLRPGMHSISVVQFKEDLIQNFTDGSWRNRPHFRARFVQEEYDIQVRINSLGLRGAECSVAKPPGTFRILVLGDSFTFGYGVREEESYAQVLERLLNRQAGATRYEVLNAGVIGFNTFSEWHYLKKTGMAFQPDLVLVGFVAGTYMGGSSGSDLYANLFYQDVPEDVPAVEIVPNPGFFARLKEHLFLYHTARVAYWKWQAARRRSARSPGPAVPDAQRYAAELEKAWVITREAFTRLRDLAARGGAQVMVAFIPIYSNIESKEPDIGDRLEAVGAELQIPVCNLFPLLLDQTGKGRNLYLLKDDGHHWNAEGHRVAAEAIYDCMVSRGLVSF